MTHIKKLVIYGFKSFARKTEIPFTPEINVILGPNGAGKSNISDALCFVLGRLSMKSIRASKSSNLIFLGTKAAGPSKEAVVEIVFDNINKTFSLDTDEISLKRIVRKNGQSIYKINNETKTRQEVLSLLAQAGIDPYGFNIVLQGEIQNFVRMHSEERRKVIEEVSGISIYESRKEKSLRELGKTEEKLKEVLAVLRERTIYLNNLEKERQQALRFKRLENDAKKYKASIINCDLTQKRKEINEIGERIDKKNKEIKKVKEDIKKVETDISNFELKIDEINSTIQKSTGIEQEKLNQEISNIRADIAGLDVKVENYENKISEISRQREELEKIIQEDELSIRELQKENPITSRKEKDLESKKQELEELEERRKRFYMLKSELKSIRERLDDKKNTLQNQINESNFLLNQLKSLSKDLFDRNTTPEKVNGLKISLREKREFLTQLVKKERESEKISYSYEKEIDKQKSLIDKISKMDVCPLCKSEITEGHIHSISTESSSRITYLKNEIENSDRELGEISKRKDMLEQNIEQLNSELVQRESDLVKISSINEKKESLRLLQERIEDTKKEISELEKRKQKLENGINENSNIEKKYELVKMEVQEISLRTKENVDSEIAFKERELDRSKISLKDLLRNENSLKEELSEIVTNLKKKRKLLDKKNEQEEKLNKKFQDFISERDSLQSRVRENQIELSSQRNSIYTLDQHLNDLKIEKARTSAEIENFEMEILEFRNVDVIHGKKEILVQKLRKCQDILSRIGSVNLRSLEVYDSVKSEYDSVKEKVKIIETEKQDILRIIQEIDVKKKRVFIKTLKELNQIFSRNFSNLSSKGKVSLGLENVKEPFEGGVSIIVKTGHGKYFDVTSLSGGEQTLVALSLIFAIQELRPYQFYILDEIDAALDKRNSERLANLLRKYMKKGQYVIVTHNDEVITNATNLYGVSMQDGISKIVSLKV